jgi:hypothetical protein
MNEIWLKNDKEWLNPVLNCEKGGEVVVDGYTKW